MSLKIPSIQEASHICVCVSMCMCAHMCACTPIPPALQGILQSTEHAACLLLMPPPAHARTWRERVFSEGPLQLHCPPCYPSSYHLQRLGLCPPSPLLMGPHLGSSPLTPLWSPGSTSVLFVGAGPCLHPTALCGVEGNFFVTT